MRIPFLILLLLCSLTAHSDDGKDQSADSKSPKKGDTIWLEEKISPPTRWIENLVKPLTVWMEQKINKPAPEPDIQQSNQENSQRIEDGTTPDINQTGSDDMVLSSALISSEQASTLAKEHIAGDVLHIKLVSKTNQYRVKLISKLGEVHIIYIKASSGKIVLPNDKVSTEPVRPISTEKDNQPNSVSDSDDDNREKP